MSFLEKLESENGLSEKRGGENSEQIICFSMGKQLIHDSSCYYWEQLGGSQVSERLVHFPAGVENVV